MAKLAHIEYAIPYDPETRNHTEHYGSRVGYIGRVRVPLKLASKLIGWEIAAKYAARNRWYRAFAPHKLHPEDLASYEGEPPYFLRADLAKTADDVVDYFVKQWGLPREEALDGMQPIDSIHRVWMIERHDPDVPVDHEMDTWYDTVERRPGAIEYWTWNW